jgi:pilus assembly protein CpaB
MSTSLRFAIILVLALAAATFGLMAYNAMQPKLPQQAGEPARPTAAGYLMAAHALPAGTLARDEDFVTHPGSSADAPPDAVADTPDAKAGLRGALIRRYLDAGAYVTVQDILRPRDRGFLASVLAPDTRAVSIKVDSESGVSGLIWPGDYVDVVLTQTQASEKSDTAHRTLSETVLRNVRIIAIDQDIVQGAEGGKDATAGSSKETHSVSLELPPEQVKTISVAKDLGRLSLAVRSAVGRHDSNDSGTVFGCDVSQEIARQSAIASQSATVVVYAGDKSKEFSVQKNASGEGNTAYGCEVAEQTLSRSVSVSDLPKQ